MKRLMQCLNVVEAYHVANLLRAAGIAAEVRNTYLAGAVGDIPFLDAGPQIWVDDFQDLDTARAALAAARAAPTQEGWWCNACGEPIEGQFAQCWRCGAGRPDDA